MFAMEAAMTQLSVIGQTLSHQALLDHGITDIVIHQTALGATLYTTSGPNGGVAAYALDAAGTLGLVDFAHFGADLSANVMGEMSMLATPEGLRLVVAGNADGFLTSYAIAEDGRIGGMSDITGLSGSTGSAVLDIDQWSGDTLFVADGGEGTIRAYAMQTADTLMQAFSSGGMQAGYAQTIFALETLRVGGVDYLIGACATAHGVTAYRIDPDRLVASGNLGSAEGIGIMTPTALGTATVGGRCFVLVGSSPGDGIGLSGAITVMELLPGGLLVPRDHVIDTLHTRFGTIQSLDVIEANGFTYVIAAGGDDGLTVFVMLPDGRLQLLHVLADTHAIGLENVSAIAAVQRADSLHIYVASEISGGLTELALETGRNGSTVFAPGNGGHATGTALDDIVMGSDGHDLLEGGLGDDIIIDGHGQDTLSGGGGRDIFVLSADGDVDIITDFEPGRDRLDLSHWPFLYDPSQLSVQPTALGAIVTWRGETLVIQTLQGTTLTSAQVIAAVVATPNRSPLGFDLSEGANRYVVGLSGADHVEGGEGNDTLLGEDGNDTLLGGRGLDLLHGGDGDDELRGNLNGDTIHGGAGFDVIYGNFGFDSLYGGSFADTIFGGNQDDQIWGEGGQDLLIGQGGNDTIRGGDGFDTIRGGADDDLLFGGDRGDQLIGGIGDDTLYGEAGADKLFGSDGNDLVEGGAGADALYGNAGEDTLLGGPGDDRLFGGAGDDRIDGGVGNDTLFGSAGVDIFVFGTTHGDDLIRDFDANGEVIDLTALGTGFGALSITSVAGGTLVTTPEGTILLEGVALGDVTADDFLL
jgi:Ca2+-binding RTX toxin-like protein